MVTKHLIIWLPLLAVCIYGQRIGNECGNDETNRFLSALDCTSFIRCQDGGTVVERCPVMTYFNHQTMTCDSDSHDQCVESSKPSRMRLLRKAYDIKPKTQPRRVDEVYNTTNEDNGKGMMICYYTNWAQYRPGFAKYTPKDLDASLCSHIHYAFAKFNSDHTIAAYEWNDESTQWMVGMYVKLNNLKKTHPGLKTVLSLGGWNLASGPFSSMVASPSKRAIFIKSVVAFLRKWNFDGLGIDWEYPGSRGSVAGDKKKFTILVQETMAAFQQESVSTGRPRLLLSAAVSAGKDTIDAAYEVDKVSNVLDYVVVMTYDFFGAWNPYTGLVNPLYPPKNATGLDALFNVDYAVKYWVSKGCPKDKLVVGVISYGRSFTLTNPSVNGLKAPANGAGTPGQYTRQAGFLSYYEVCKMIKNGAKTVQLEDEKVPYLYCENQWVTYEDQTSIAIKADYINNGGYAGAAMWAAPLDDFKGNACGQGPYPLLSTVSKKVRKIH